MTDAFEDLLRDESPRVLGALVRRYGDFALVEDAVQEALLTAWERWGRDGSVGGAPDQPAAWLMTTARNRVLDQLRRESQRPAKETAAMLSAFGLRADVEPPDGAESFTDAADDDDPLPEPLHDDQLRLVFLCAHPALSQEARVALTLRAVAGLSTAEIARAFLVPEATMSQRISRAKRKITVAGMRFQLPAESELVQRLSGVLQVVYLVFNEGYAANYGEHVVRVDLCAEAIRLGRLLRTLLPHDGEVAGLLALMLLHDARRGGRVDADGALVPLAKQDRSTWDRAQIAEGCALIEESLADRPLGQYQLQAAIAALHAEAVTSELTDWPQILALYQLLERLRPGPLVTLNRAVALAEVDGDATGLAVLDALQAGDDAVSLRHRLPAARGHLLERLGRYEEAADAYALALAFSPSPPERRYLQLRLQRLSTPSQH